MDPIQQTASQNGTLNTITGTIGKGFDTFLDALAIGAANKIIGSDYPTGQESPEAVAARLKAAQDAAAVKPINWQPWVVGGTIAVAGLLATALLFRK